MLSRNSTSTLSLESQTSYSISKKIEREKQISPTNEEDGASENCSKHSGETSNSSGTNATSHLTVCIPENESSRETTVEEDTITAAASR